MKQHRKMIGTALALVFGIAFATLPARAGNQGGTPVPPAPGKSLEEKWGIQITSLRMSARGHMVDFRYKVIDPNKAAALADREAKPYLLDETSGTKLLVPKSPKVGPLRQTAQKPAAGKIYFALFANPGNLVKPGSKVTVVMGDFQAQNLIVE